MTTTTYINVELDAPADPWMLEQRFRAYFRRDSDRDLDWLVSGMDGDLAVNESSLSFWANSKYQIEGARSVARSMSGAHPTASVSFSEEWDDDGYGEERVDYLNGSVVSEKEAAVVPANLDALVKELEECVAASRAAAEGDSNDAEIEAGLALADAAQALVEAYRA